MSVSVKPSVDVVVPCYNYGHYLETCVRSVLTQDGVDVRVLIIDDVSKDNSVEVAERLAAADARVSVLKHKTNKGLVGTANDGVIDWATAKYTLLLSADDALTDGALRRATSVMEAHPDVSVVYGMALVVERSEQMVSPPVTEPFQYRVITGPEFLEQSCLHWCGIASPTALIRTETQHLVGGLDPRFPTTCDMEIWMRIATRASLASINAPQAFYRRHQANMSNPVMSAPLSDLPQQLATAEVVLNEWGEDMPGAENWLKAMKARMVAQACWMAGFAFKRGDDEAARICEEFAKKHHKNVWLSKFWLRYQAKRLLGRQLAISVARKPKKTADPSIEYSPFERGSTFGWWPENVSNPTMMRKTVGS